VAMKIDRIQPEGMSVRMQQGKPAYSHVVTVTGPGKTIYIAGQLARDAEGNIVGAGDMRAQLEQTFKNLDACLKAAGATWADVVKTNTFVTDYQAFSQCSDVRMRYFGIASPTSTTIQVRPARRSRSAVSLSQRLWSRSRSSRRSSKLSKQRTDVAVGIDTIIRLTEEPPGAGVLPPSAHSPPDRQFPGLKLERRALVPNHAFDILIWHCLEEIIYDECYQLSPRACQKIFRSTILRVSEQQRRSN
jgi:enamine deaminase RidA (YjgF/YER057c/UK114 family)